MRSKICGAMRRESGSILKQPCSELFFSSGQAVCAARFLATRMIHTHSMETILEADITCPHCGESFPVNLDTSQGNHLMVEDCTVCCRPIQLTVTCQPGVILAVDIEPG